MESLLNSLSNHISQLLVYLMIPILPHLSLSLLSYLLSLFSPIYSLSSLLSTLSLLSYLLSLLSYLLSLSLSYLLSLLSYLLSLSLLSTLSFPLFSSPALSCLCCTGTVQVSLKWTSDKRKSTLHTE